MIMEEKEEMKERLIECFGAETVMNEVFKWLDTDTKIQMVEDIYRVYDLDIA